MPQSKPWYFSKTFWVNFATACVTLLTVFGFTPNQELAEELTRYALALNPLINLILRAVTSKQVTL